MEKDIKANIAFFDSRLHVDTNFDVIGRRIIVGGKESCFYFVDGFCKDELMEKMLQYFMGLKEEEMPSIISFK